MKISIIAVGKAKKKQKESELFEHYKSRIGWKIEIKEVELKKKTSSIDEKKQKEGELLLNSIPKGAFIIALDENGSQIKSEEFAKKLQQIENNSFSKIAFIIGGADGLSKEVLQKSHYKLSFGKMVWAHMLIRAMLAEQIYRAKSIIDNHPYHRA